ncbi:hypothetical protein SA18_0378 [Salmonella enterica subsp. enterica serovar Agona str. 18.H.07]|nr:hypothetical protein SA18_0378 [Salmonella enterica subsp. enterica serovar Agona str. 18.H.07]
MHISANVLPISPECWRKSLKMRTIQRSLPISPECWRKSLKMRTIQRSGFDEKMARYES